MKKEQRTIVKEYEQGEIWWHIRDEDNIEFGVVATLDEAIRFGVDAGHTEAFRLIECEEPRFLIRDGSGRGWCVEKLYTEFDSDDRAFISDTAAADEEEYGHLAQTFGEWLDDSDAGDEYDNDDQMFTVIRIN
jgi:hypothetical protein